MTVSRTPIEDLYRKTDITTRIRYISAYRLKTHQWLSLWTTTFLSVGLITIPLFQALGVPPRNNAQFLDALEVFLAVLLLAYSLLLGTENFAGRAERMQSCGTELSGLTRDIFSYKSAVFDEKIYSAFTKRYQDILERYENHDDIDYKLYTLITGLLQSRVSSRPGAP